MKVLDEKPLALVKGGNSEYRFGKFVGMTVGAVSLLFGKH